MCLRKLVHWGDWVPQEAQTLLGVAPHSPQRLYVSSLRLEVAHDQERNALLASGNAVVDASHEHWLSDEQHVIFSETFELLSILHVISSKDQASFLNLLIGKGIILLHVY